MDAAHGSLMLRKVPAPLKRKRTDYVALLRVQCINEIDDGERQVVGVIDILLRKHDGTHPGVSVGWPPTYKYFFIDTFLLRGQQSIHEVFPL